MVLKSIKEEIARSLNDEYSEKPWHEWVNRFVVACLLVNAVVVFLETYTWHSTEVNQWLAWADTLTTVVFLVEVTIRIWTADVFNAKYKGLVGRLRYCLTPYGLIDVISTYPSALAWFGLVSPMMFKALRVIRLIRLFRFMKSFQLLFNAINNKRQELLLSLSFLCVITFVLSIALFHVERLHSPEKYATGMDPLLWAFLQYIGDPGGLAENGPESFAGKVISSIIGVLGIAVFAVPTGLIGSGFVEEVEAHNKRKSDRQNAEKIRTAFERRLCRFTKFQTVPIYLTLTDLKVSTMLNEGEILDAVDTADDLRLNNLAQSLNVEDRPVSELVVELFPLNRPYGCMINRHSKVTIVDTSSYSELGMGHFAFYLALIGGFNFVSRELGHLRPYKSFYQFDNVDAAPHLREFVDDIRSLANQNDHYVFFILASAGGMEAKLPTDIHFNYGGKKGDETYNDPNITLHRTEEFEKFYQDVSKQLEEEHQLLTDKQRYYDTSSPRNIMHHLKQDNGVNYVAIRIKWSLVTHDLHRYALAKTLSDTIAHHLGGGEREAYDPLLYVKGSGYKDYNI